MFSWFDNENRYFVVILSEIFKLSQFYRPNRPKYGQIRACFAKILAFYEVLLKFDNTQPITHASKPIRPSKNPLLAMANRGSIPYFSNTIAFSRGQTLGVSTNGGRGRYIRAASCHLLSVGNRRSPFYLSLHFTTRSLPGKSLITSAGVYLPSSLSILRRSSPWS